MHAATRHCYYQRATLQLLLRQLRFCAAELAGIRQKQLQIADIGVQYFNRWAARMMLAGCRGQRATIEANLDRQHRRPVR